MEGEDTGAEYQTVGDCLPNELLSMIFEFGVADLEGKTAPDWGLLSAFLHSITAVSRRWREVAHKTPTLWGNLWLGVRESPYEGLQYYPLKTCLDRTGITPIDVWANGEAQIEEVLDILVSSAAGKRVRSLHLQDFQYWDDPHSRAKQVTRITTLECTGLEMFTVSAFHQMGPDDFLALLRHHDGIQSLRILHTYLSPSADWTCQPIVLPQLKWLQVQQVEPWEVEDVLSCISAPQLESLILLLGDGEYQNPLVEHVLTLRGPVGIFDSLRELTLGGPLSTADVKGVLLHTRYTETLQLLQGPDIKDIEDYDLVRDHDRLLDDLEPPHAVQVMIPNLKILSFDRFNFSADAISRLFVNRNKRFKGRLKAIGMSEKSQRSFQVEDLAALRQMVNIFEWAPPTFFWSDWDRNR